MHPLAKAFSFLLILPGLLTLSGCIKKESVGLYDPNDTGASSPTITSMNPAGGAFAGMDTIIIQGTNFSPAAKDNTVYFDADPAELLSSSPTQIALRAPVVTSDSVRVRIAVRGTLSFSNTFAYRLIAGVVKFGGLDSSLTSASLATDATGNLYIASGTGGRDAGILKLTATGVRSTYANPVNGISPWTSLKMGPAGYLYAARNVRAVFRFAPGGGTAPTLWASLPTGALIKDMDFDQDGNLWGGGTGTSIYRVDRNLAVATYPFAGAIRALRVYNGYLYIAAQVSGAEKIWRAQITAGALGTPEVYYDFGAAYPVGVPLAITFSSDGTMFIGTDMPEGLIVVSPSKMASAPFRAYRSLFGTGVGFLVWGSADDLYASISGGTLLRFTVRGKTSAPYYGSTL